MEKNPSMFLRYLQASIDRQNQDQGEDEPHFLLVRWSDKHSFDIVSESQFKGSWRSVKVLDACTINFNGRNRQGTVLIKGTRADCERLQYNVAMRPSIDTASAGSTVGQSAANIVDQLDSGSDDDSTESSDENEIRNAVLGQILKLLTSPPKGDEGNREEHNVCCDACGNSSITSDRYKCLNCSDVDLCAGCFERRREFKQHKSGHAFAHFKSPGELFGEAVSENDMTLPRLKAKYGRDVHDSVSCDGCRVPSITGLRFKCDTCPNYDLCQRCMERGATSGAHASSHPLYLVALRALPRIPVEDIELGHELGKGAFGAVHEAKWLSKNRRVACKVIVVPPTPQAAHLEKSFLKEMAAYTELSGAYILKIYGFAAGLQGSSKVFMLLMEFMSRGSLARVIDKEGNKLSLRRKLDMAINIACGMRKIHEHRMIHRDIRPDNILVNEDYVAKIGDMGIARVVDPLSHHTQIGCLPFMPPEFHAGKYDQKLDIFTFGLTLNQLFTSTMHAFQPLVRNKIAFQVKSPVFGELIARCTAHDPQRRPAAIEIEKTLELYSQGFNEIVMKEHANYQRMSIEDKDRIFTAFYRKFHKPAMKFIGQRFPSEFLEDPHEVPGVKVGKDAAEGTSVECPVQ